MFLQDNPLSLVSEERVESVNRDIEEAFYGICARLTMSEPSHNRIDQCLKYSKNIGYDSFGKIKFLNFAPGVPPLQGCEVMKLAVQMLVEDSLKSVYIRNANAFPHHLIDFDQERASFLGQGSQGTVFAYPKWTGLECSNLSPRRSEVLAVKILSNTSEDSVGRELQFLRLPRHPNVLAILGARVDRINAYGPCSKVLVMMAYDLAKGGSLEDALRDGRPLPESVVKGWVVQALRGLQHLHVVARVAHLDVKPGNLLLGGGPPGGNQLRICDFGSCVAIGTRCEESHGTPLYMSPTQVACALLVLARGFSILTPHTNHSIADSVAYRESDTKGDKRACARTRRVTRDARLAAS
jgi:serine/threonine protein kinase